MPNVAQHEAAELWELSRDHLVIGAKLEFLCNQVRDTQLRSTLEQHARRCRQIGQQLQGFFHGGHGQSASTFSSQPAGTYGSSYGMSSANMGTQSLDAIVAADCLKDCKSLAVRSMTGATETSQPARNFLYQIAGEHLRMAEEQYHWLEQRGLYASPRSDQSTIQQYTQALSQVAQAGQSTLSTQFTGQFQPQSQTYGYSTSGQFTPSSQQFGSTPASQFSQSGASFSSQSGTQFGQTNHGNTGNQYSPQ